MFNRRMRLLRLGHGGGRRVRGTIIAVCFNQA